MLKNEVEFVWGYDSFNWIYFFKSIRIVQEFIGLLFQNFRGVLGIETPSVNGRPWIPGGASLVLEQGKPFRSISTISGPVVK
jgi:hypothetical protein